MRHGVVPLRETYAIGGEFLVAKYEHDNAQHDGRDRNVPLPDYDRHTRLLVVLAAVLDPA